MQPHLFLDQAALEVGFVRRQREGLPDIAERTTTEPATTPAGRSVVLVRG